MSCENDAECNPLVNLGACCAYGKLVELNANPVEVDIFTLGYW